MILEIIFSEEECDLIGDMEPEKVALDLRVTVSTDNPRLQRALERQSAYQGQSIEEYVTSCIAFTLVSDEGQSELNPDGSVTL
jgi:hypothetical protein